MVNRSDALIPQYTSRMSHNVPFYNTYVHFPVTKWYILRYLFIALWDLRDRSTVFKILTTNARDGDVMSIVASNMTDVSMFQCTYSS